MQVNKVLSNVFKDSFKLVINNPILWLFFYVFVIFDLLIVRYVPEGLNRLLLLVLNLLVIGLPGLKVEFLDSLSKDKQPQFNEVPKLLFYYFKKLFWVNLFLIFLGSVFFVLSGMILVLVGSPSALLFGYPVSELIRLIVFLPLAVVYFSLFHLFVVILFKKKKGITETLKLSVDYIKRNKEIVAGVVLLSLIVHYPLSELVMAGLGQLGNIIDPFLIRAVVSFFNVIIDLFFFAVWMVLYNKKS
jgi:hypothetical protein